MDTRSKIISGLVFLAIVSTLSVYFLMANSRVVQGEITGDEITVYNPANEWDSGLVFVKRTVDAELKDTLSTVSVSDMPETIIPNSVIVIDKDKSSSVLEMNYDFSIVSSGKMLEKNIGKTIEVATKDKQFKGELVKYDGSTVILKTAEGILSIPFSQITWIRFDEIPKDYTSTPVLSWTVQNYKTGKHSYEVDYLASGASWDCAYVVYLKDKEKAKFVGNVKITNLCGASWNDVNLNLVAGDIHRVLAERGYADRVMLKAAPAETAQPQFKRTALEEYYMYALQRKVTLKDKETKVIPLVQIEDVSYEKQFMYDAQRWGENSKVAVIIHFKNSKENGLGEPLPKGIIRVYRTDGQGSVQFLGEDEIDHTPKDEDVDVWIGNAFDLVGESDTVSQRSCGTYCWETTRKITLRNHKDEDVRIKVKDQWSPNCRIVESSENPEKKKGSYVQWDVPVPKNGEKTISWTYKCEW